MPKIAIARQRGALVVALVLVSQAVVVLVAPSAAAHHTVTPPPTSITLTTSKSVVRAGEQFTLIATTDKTVQYGSSSVSLFDLTANVGRGSWTSGSVFNANLTIGDGQLEHRYEARVHHGGMVLATARVTVTHAPWVVTMTLVPEAAEWVTWRVTTGDQDVGNTGSVLKIVLVNKTTNQYMGSCNKTSTCAASDLVAKGEAREYQAHVAVGTSWPMTEVRASSNVVGLPARPEQTRGCGNPTRTANPTVRRGDGVNTATGAMCETTTDLTLPGPGVPFALTRSYNSDDPTSGLFGQGWSDPFSVGLTVTPGLITMRNADGQQVRYTRFSSGTIKGDRGADSKLVAVSGGFLLTTPGGIKYQFDSVGALQSVKDRHGLGLAVARTEGRITTVTDAAGRAATFDYVGDRVSRVALPDGRSVEYGYTDGRLSSRRDPAGTTTSYGYDAGGRLVTVTDPLGHTTSRTVYDPASGRVVEQVDALGNRTTFAWDPATETATTTDPRGGVVGDVYEANVLVRSTTSTGSWNYGYDGNFRRTHVTDPLGRVSTTTYDAVGNVLSTKSPDPLALTERFTYNANNQLLTAVDGRGTTVLTNAYDTAGRLTTTTDVLGGRRTYVYGTGDQVTATTDPLGKTSSFEYDGVGNLTATVSALGRRSTISYDSAGRVLTTRSPGGAETSYTYDAVGRLLTRTDALGAVIRYTYDAAGRLVTRTDAVGGVTSYEHDDNGRLMAVVEPGEARSTTAYDANGNVVSVTDALGHRTTAAYDSLNRRIATTSPRGNEPGADPAAFTTSYGYDAVANLTSVNEPAPGGTTAIAYDAANRVVSVTDPLGNTTGTAYDGSGNVVETTDALGRRTTTTYDLLNRPVAVVDPVGNTARIAYDAAGRVGLRTSPMGGVTTYAYDHDHRLVAVVDPRGNAPGADPAAFTTRLEYDSDGNTSAVVDPLGHVASTTYDAVGRPVSRSDARGGTTAYGYDALGRLASVRGPDVAPSDVTATTGLTRYTYDVAGNVAQRTDPLGRVATFEYDAARRLTASTGSGGARTTFAYDAASNRVATTTPAGNATAVPDDGTVTEAYDVLGRPTELSFSDSTPPVTYTYDALGRQVRMDDGVGRGAQGRMSFYDAVGNLIGVTRGSQSFAYRYDTAGRLTETTYPNGLAVSYGWNADSRLSSVSADGATTTYGYDVSGNLMTTSLPEANGHVETHALDAAGRVVTVRNASSTGVLSEFARELDAVGNPVRESVTRGGQTVVTAYEYDDASRLRRVCTGAATCAAAPAVLSYQYDWVGNRIGEVRSGVSPSSRSYTYDAADRLVTSVVDGATTTYSSDANGNVTGEVGSAGHRAYSYDLANRMTSASMTEGGVTRAVAYALDGDGNRVTRSVDGALVDQFVWDPLPSLPTLALRLDAEDAVRERVVHGLAPVSVTDAPGTAYFHHDVMGSVSDLTSAVGQPLMRYDHGAFGEPTATELAPGAPANSLRFTGQLLDPETGLLHLHAREYDSATGRFLSVDPVSPPLADPMPSTYVYAANRPGVFVDPAGLWPKWLDDAGNYLKEAGQQWGAVLDGAVEGGKAGIDWAATHVSAQLPEWATDALDAMAGNQVVQAASGVGNAMVKSTVGLVTAVANPLGTIDQLTEACAQTYIEASTAPGGGVLSGIGACVAQPVKAVAESFVTGWDLANRGCVAAASEELFNGLVAVALPVRGVAGRLAATSSLAGIARVYATPRSLGAARHPVFDRVDAAVERHRGKPVEHGFQFPNRRAATQAASEIVGDLGPSPSRLRVADIDEAGWRGSRSRRIVGQESGGSGWRDDFLGHVYPDGSRIGPHINVKVAGVDDLPHLIYPKTR